MSLFHSAAGVAGLSVITFIPEGLKAHAMFLLTPCSQSTAINFAANLQSILISKLVSIRPLVKGLLWPQLCSIRFSKFMYKNLIV